MSDATPPTCTLYTAQVIYFHAVGGAGEGRRGGAVRGEGVSTYSV